MEILVGGESVKGAVNNGDGAGGGGSFVVETYDGATNTALPTILAVASGGGGGGKGNGLSGAAKKRGETGSDGVPFITADTTAPAATRPTLASRAAVPPITTAVSAAATS